MRGQRAQQATASLGTSALVGITERVADVALLSGQLVTLGWPEVLDRPIPRPGTPRGRRWGWTAVLWRASIGTAGAPRTGSVATSVKGMQPTLSRWTAQ